MSLSVAVHSREQSIYTDISKYHTYKANYGKPGGPLLLPSASESQMKIDEIDKPGN
jgi:hypothetical protein